MEILLIDNVWFPAERFTTGDTLLKVNITASEYESRVVRGNQEHEEYRKKIVEASKDYWSRNQRSLCIHIKNGANGKCIFRVHGFLWEKHDKLSLEGVRIRLQLCFFPYVFGPVYSTQVCAEIPITPNISAIAGNFDPENESCLSNECFSEATNVSFYKHHLFSSIIGADSKIFSYATITLVSDTLPKIPISNRDLLAVANSGPIAITRICRMILDSKIHSDVVLVANDGAQFYCNKSFLAAHSPVLATMLDSEMNGAKVEMVDMSPDGIKALLEYIYTCDLEMVLEQCQISLELLQASHQYEMKALKKQVTAVLLKKEVEWFNVDVAFSLFLFARKFDSMKEIKFKSVSVLKTKRQKIMDCMAYKKELNANPNKAAIAVLELFCL